MSNELVPLSDLEKMAAAIAKSGLFGVKTPEQAMAIMLVAQSEGMHPMSAVQEFDIIQGRPARKSWAMLARFQRAGGSVEWHERTDTKAAATFSHSQGGSITVDWTMERAKKAGLAGKENWTKYPRAMLSARCISEGVRAVFPGATGGFYTPEEERDMVDVTPPKPKGKPLAKESIIPHDPETGEILPANGEDIFPPHELDAPEQREIVATANPAKERAVAEANRDHVFGKLDGFGSAEMVDKYIARHKNTIEGFPADIRDAIYNRATDRIEALSASGT